MEALLHTNVEPPNTRTPLSSVHVKHSSLASRAAGSGKTCIAHLIATGAPAKGVRQTVGCSTSVVLVEPADASGLGDARQQRQVFIELWDIGGFEQLNTIFAPMLARGLSWTEICGPQA